ncbi:MAG: hypothetical protein NTW30_06260, partial [Candidatus Aenigmarchaeota archaeon]|nr:hypothetical protein [Candidatus Aenigmarchaeota archaeon]
MLAKQFTHFPKMTFPKKGAFRPTANQHDAVRSDASMMALAQNIAVGRGEDEQLSKEYIARRMEQRERININKVVAGNKGTGKKLSNFYQHQMGGVYNTKQLATMYGIYQDDGEQKMFETIRPMNLQKGDIVYSNTMGEIGVLQDNLDRGNECILVFQDRSIRIEKSAHGLSRKNFADDAVQSETGPIAASSAQGPALFKEQVESPQKKFIDDTMKKIIDECNHQEDAHTPKNDLMKGIEVEKEHAETFKKIGKEDSSIEEAATLVAKDHIKENPDYYKNLTLGKGKEMLVSQDNSDIVETASFGFKDRGSEKVPSSSAPVSTPSPVPSTPVAHPYIGPSSPGFSMTPKGAAPPTPIVQSKPSIYSNKTKSLGGTGTNKGSLSPLAKPKEPDFTSEQKGDVYGKNLKPINYDEKISA